MIDKPGRHFLHFLHRGGRLPVVAAALMLILIGCTQNSSPGDSQDAFEDRVNDFNEASFSTPVIAIDGEITISKQELRDAFENLYSKPVASDAGDEAADRTIDAVLKTNYLYAEAERLGVEPDQAIKENLKVIKPVFIGRAYRTTLGKDIQIDETVADALIPETTKVIRYSQIVHPDLAFAQVLRERAAKGEDFAELARQYSTGPAAQKGGLIKEPLVTAFPAPYDENIAQRLSILEVGEVSPVLNAGLGYTIFKVEEKRDLFPDERQKFRKNIMVNLEYSAGRQMLSAINAKFPLVEIEGAIKEALETGDPDLVVARIGDESVTWGWLRKAVELLWVKGNELVQEKDPDVWGRYLREMSGDLALNEEARQQGFAESDLVMENMARAWKDLIVKTYQDEIQVETKPTEPEVYQAYLEELAQISGGQPTQEAIFSIIGVQGLTNRETAITVASRFAEGEPARSIISDIPSGGNPELIEGTFKDKDFDLDTLIILESTPAGQVTEPVPQSGQWSVYHLLGKNRGEMPAFDQMRERIEARVWNRAYNEELDKIYRRNMLQRQFEFLFGEKETRELIARWLDLQKAMKGISPEGGYHKGGMGISPKPGVPSPHGVPNTH